MCFLLSFLLFFSFLYIFASFLLLFIPPSRFFLSFLLSFFFFHNFFLSCFICPCSLPSFLLSSLPFIFPCFRCSFLPPSFSPILPSFLPSFYRFPSSLPSFLQSITFTPFSPPSHFTFTSGILALYHSSPASSALKCHCSALMQVNVQSWILLIAISYTWRGSANTVREPSVLDLFCCVK